MLWVFLECSTALKMENDGAWVTARATHNFFFFFLDPQLNQTVLRETHSLSQRHTHTLSLSHSERVHVCYTCSCPVALLVTAPPVFSLGNRVLAFSQSGPWRPLHLCELLACLTLVPEEVEQ